MYDIMDQMLYYSSLASNNRIDNCDEYNDNCDECDECDELLA